MKSDYRPWVIALDSPSSFSCLLAYDNNADDQPARQELNSF